LKNLKSSTKIKSVRLNNYAKKITVEVNDQTYDLPFAKLLSRPTHLNPIIEVFVDPDLGNEAVTYMLKDGKVDSVPVDAFFDYNRSPDYLKKIFLFEMTHAALERIKKTKISKNEICSRLKTSPSQLARLLDPGNSKKTIDKMLELLVVLDVDVQLKCA